MTDRSKRRLLTLLSIAAAAALAAPQASASELRFSTTTEGGVAITGNALGLSKQPGVNGPGVLDAIGAFTSLNAASIDAGPGAAGSPGWFGGTTSSWRQNGAAADLAFPNRSDVLYAELIWGGSHRVGGEDVSAELDSAVTLSAAGGSTLVSPDPATAQTVNQPDVSGTFSYNYYLRSADVTAFVDAHGPGAYEVSGVPATQTDLSNSLSAAGWTLVVVYGNADAPTRNMTVFVGGSFVDENAVEDYTASGFCAPPTGEVHGRLFVSAIEGDANRPGDQMMLAPTASGPFEAVSGPFNPVDNFFASQINGADGQRVSAGTFGDRNHDPNAGTNVVGGRQGWDITGVSVSSQLVNAQTSAVIRATSVGDSYLPTLVAFSLDVNAPDFDLAFSTLTSDDVVNVGDVVTYEVYVDNLAGAADAEDVIFYNPLPDGLTLVDFRVDGASLPGVSTADLTTGVTIGRVAFGDLAIVEVDARVDALPAPPARAEFETQAWWSYDYRTCASAPPTSGAAFSQLTELGAPRLDVQITAAPLGAGRIDYTVTVSNTGTAASADATLSVGLPPGATYVAGSTTMNGAGVADVGAQGPFLQAGGAPVASAGDAPGVISHGDAAVVRYQVQLSGAGGGAVTATAAADPDGALGPAPAVEGSVTTELGDCGDGLVSGAEQCDDGDLDAGDGCSPGCSVEDGHACHGVPSACGVDTDGDGLSDDHEVGIGTNPVDVDSDDDGLSDGVEVLGANPTDPLNADTDDDGLCDGPAPNLTVCRGGEDGEDANADGVRQANETDPNDADTDDGGVFDGVEVERGTDPLDPADDIAVDSDGDGLSDDLEADLGTNPALPDSDGDGLCDGPLSVAGVCDGGEDTNANGVVDPGETDPTRADTDGDGLSDGVEVGGETHTDPLDADTDDDGLCDGAAAVADLCDGGEDANNNGVVDPGETDPTRADTDGGGVDDGVEVERGTDPLDPSDDLTSDGGDGGDGDDGAADGSSIADSGLDEEGGGSVEDCGCQVAGGQRGGDLPLGGAALLLAAFVCVVRSRAGGMWGTDVRLVGRWAGPVRARRDPALAEEAHTHNALPGHQPE